MPVKRFSICSGRVVDPSQGMDEPADIHIADGKILAIGDKPDDFTAEQTIDASGLVVSPGLVDLSARLREPGQEHKATIASETRAAACNGITTLCCPPDTKPVIDTPAVAELLQQRSEASGMSQVLPLAALTQGLQGKHLAEMGDLKEAGCVGVSNALKPIEDTRVLAHAFDYAASCDLSVFIQPIDPWLGRDGFVHEGQLSTRMGLAGIPSSTETIALSRDLLLIEQTGVRAHFCRISTAGAVALIREAKARKLPVTADVCAHQLFLTEVDLGPYDSQCHVYPPLRSQRDQDALRQGVADGTIDAICSDHQPHEPDAKLAPFDETEPGISALDTLLPLTLRLGREIHKPLVETLSYLSHAPAKILGNQAGTLQVGQQADLCLIDTQNYWQLNNGSFNSRCHNSPFLDWELQGRCVATFIRGRQVFSKIQT